VPNGDAIIGGSTSVNVPHLNNSLVVIGKDNLNTSYPFYVGQPAGSDIFWVRGNGNGSLLGKLGFGPATPKRKVAYSKWRRHPGWKPVVQSYASQPYIGHSVLG
jgi:hypothetical protein